MDAVEVWGNTVPYLTSVDSPEGDEVPNYHSTVTVPLDEFKSKLLAQYPQADLSASRQAGLPNLVPNSAGGVETVDIGGVTVGGGSLRTLFGLRSTSFTVSGSADGVTFSVTGYGHGVGMSQYGANALAKEGEELRRDFEVVLHRHRRGPLYAPEVTGGPGGTCRRGRLRLSIERPAEDFGGKDTCEREPSGFPFALD